MIRGIGIGIGLGLGLMACAPESPQRPSVEAQRIIESSKPVFDSFMPVVEPVPAQDGFFMAEGAPPPRGCKVAADCVGNTIPDLDNPCCQEPTSLEPHAWAYRTWLVGWRSNNCAAVTCPPPPNPSQPPACAFEVDCVAGSCLDACGQR